jgi:DNA-binding protein HU-beta
MAASGKMSKSAIASCLAEAAGISKKQAVLFLEEQANLAYAQAKNGFVIPGLGKLELKQRKARMGRNPATGEPIKIPAKKVVKFRVAKAAKDAILGNGAPKKAAKKAAPKKKAAKKK